MAKRAAATTRGRKTRAGANRAVVIGKAAKRKTAAGAAAAIASRLPWARHEHDPIVENLAHHIKEEEREMFRIARAVLSRDELNDLGVRMKTLKTELEA